MYSQLTIDIIMWVKMPKSDLNDTVKMTNTNNGYLVNYSSKTKRKYSLNWEKDEGSRKKIVKEHSVIIIMLNCYATNYFNNFNLLKILHLVYFLFRTMMITKINEKVLLDFR